MRRSGFLKSVTKVFSHPIASVGISAVGGMVAERLADQSGLVDALTSTGMGALNVLGIGQSKKAEAPAVGALQPMPIVPDQSLCAKVAACEAAKNTFHPQFGPGNNIRGVEAPPVVGGAAAHVERVEEELQVGCGATACAPCAAKAAAAAAAAATPAPAPVDIGAVEAKKSELEGKLKSVLHSSPAFKQWADEAKAAGFTAYAPFIVASSEVTPSTAPEVGDVPDVGSNSAPLAGGGTISRVGDTWLLTYPNFGPLARHQESFGGSYSKSSDETRRHVLASAQQTMQDYFNKYGATASQTNATKKLEAEIKSKNDQINKLHNMAAKEKDAARRANYQAQIQALESQLAATNAAQAAIYTNPAVAQQIAASPTDALSQVIQEMMQMRMLQSVMTPAAAPAPAYPPGYGYPPPAAPYGYPQQPYAVDAYGSPAVYGDPQQQYETANLVDQGIDPNQAMDIDPGLTGPSALDGGQSFEQDLAYSLEGVGDSGDSDEDEDVFSDSEEEPVCAPCQGR